MGSGGWRLVSVKSAPGALNSHSHRPERTVCRVTASSPVGAQPHQGPTTTPKTFTRHNNNPVEPRNGRQARNRVSNDAQLRSLTRSNASPTSSRTNADPT